MDPTDFKYWERFIEKKKFFITISDLYISESVYTINVQS